MFLCIEFLCVLQDAQFIDLLTALSVMKVFLLRGNKHCREVRCLCFTYRVSQGRSCLDSKCHYEVDVQPEVATALSLSKVQFIQVIKIHIV